MKFTSAIAAILLLVGVTFAVVLNVYADCPCKEKEKQAACEKAKAEGKECPFADKNKSEEKKAATGKAQEKCPVMGGAINKEIFVDYKGKRVYFCCKGCIETFNKDPERYMKKLADDGVELEAAPAALAPAKKNAAKEEKVQTLCPVMGGPINKSVYADYKGKRVYFCCKGCIAKFNKDPETYIKKMEADGVKLEDAPGK